MRIFQGFLIVLISVFLFMLPVSQAIYDYRTDEREEYFNYETGAFPTGNVQLHYPIHEDDTSTVAFLSDLSTDIPLFSAYNSTNRLLDITGLTVNSNRTLRVYYDVNALIGNEAIEVLMGWLPYIWYLMICVMPMVAIYAIIKGRT